MFGKQVAGKKESDVFFYVKKPDGSPLYMSKVITSKDPEWVEFVLNTQHMIGGSYLEFRDKDRVGKSDVIGTTIALKIDDYFQGIQELPIICARQEMQEQRGSCGSVTIQNVTPGDVRIDTYSFRLDSNLYPIHARQQRRQEVRQQDF
jgi:hypothetical protein